MPEDNEASNKARRVSHLMRQVRKRATVTNAPDPELVPHDLMELAGGDGNILESFAAAEPARVRG